MNVLEKIKKFVLEISNEYPLLHIEYEYTDEEDEYIIWHNDSKLEFDDSTFKSYVAKAARKHLFNNGIYNFCFIYDHFKSMKLSELKENTPNKYNPIPTAEANMEYNYTTTNKKLETVSTQDQKDKNLVYAGSFKISFGVYTRENYKKYSESDFLTSVGLKSYKAFPFKEAS